MSKINQNYWILPQLGVYTILVHILLCYRRGFWFLFHFWCCWLNRVIWPFCSSSDHWFRSRRNLVRQLIVFYSSSIWLIHRVRLLVLETNRRGTTRGYWFLIYGLGWIRWLGLEDFLGPRFAILVLFHHRRWQQFMWGFPGSRQGSLFDCKLHCYPGNWKLICLSSSPKPQWGHSVMLKPEYVRLSYSKKHW